MCIDLPIVRLIGPDKPKPWHRKLIQGAVLGTGKHCPLIQASLSINSNFIVHNFFADKARRIHKKVAKFIATKRANGPHPKAGLVSDGVTKRASRASLLKTSPPPR